MEQKIRKRFDESVGLIRMAEEHLTTRITQAADLIAGALKSGGTVFLFGNGGSAADAQHFACELVGRFLKDRPPLRAEALAADAATMTAVANDYGYEMIFARQLAGKARKGDVAVALSTSGDSANVIAALDKARQIGLATIAMTGSAGG
ncbi:MAG: SIS domain-containing protein, partial [Phycisphaerae bacterium]|nr:SIS domain-containing protein [Phycisphaerae bacterium]